MNRSTTPRHNKNRQKTHLSFYSLIILLGLLAIGIGTTPLSGPFALDTLRVHAQARIQMPDDPSQQGNETPGVVAIATVSPTPEHKDPVSPKPEQENPVPPTTPEKEQPDPPVTPEQEQTVPPAAPQKENAPSAENTQQSGVVADLTSMQTLSPDLAAYLATLGPNVGVEIYDVTQQHSYTYNNTAQFLTASSIKVPIMLAFFDMTERQERKPDAKEMQLLTAMIEHSDNDATTALYYKINRATGLASYLQRIGVSGMEVNNSAWGYSLITPHTMVELLAQLNQGTILTANDRETALGLMQHVEADQQWGVGDTAPEGANVAMKNGWVPGPDGLWTVNTSGIVNTETETYIISVYTQEQSSLADGQAIVQRVCGAVASILQ